MKGKLTRREFLELSGKTGAMIGAGSLAGLSHAHAAPGKAGGRGVADATIGAGGANDGGGGDSAAVKRPGTELKAVVVKGAPGVEVARTVARALDLLGGIGRFVKSGNIVVLKPNIGFPASPEMGATTSPEVVRAMAELCLGAGASRVMVLDYPVRRPSLCLDRSGIGKSCKGLSGVHTLTLAHRKFYTEKKIPGGEALHSVEIAKDILEADVFINLPTAKSHSATGVSFGLKNLMGAIWDRNIFHSKVDLDKAIVDLASVLRSHLTVLDAARALTTGGPGGPGDVLKLDTIVAGTDPVAVDACGVELTHWYGRKFAARQVKHILYAAERGLGNLDTASDKIWREPVSQSGDA